MARPSKSIPSYRHHKKTGQAVVTVRKADGARTDVSSGQKTRTTVKRERECGFGWFADGNLGPGRWATHGSERSRSETAVMGVGMRRC
jgi:hypothetical protein